MRAGFGLVSDCHGWWWGVAWGINVLYDLYVARVVFLYEVASHVLWQVLRRDLQVAEELLYHVNVGPAITATFSSTTFSSG